MSQRFHDLMLPLDIEPRSEVSGFVLTGLHSGTVRTINVDILGGTELTSFNFFLEIPGFLADHQMVDFSTLYRDDELIHCDTMEALRKEIEALPCCVANADGTAYGAPLDIVIVTTPDAAWRAMVRRGWHETESITVKSAIKTVDAFMARKTIHERNHLRLWLTPIRYKEASVWVGTISRDIGVKMTTKAWSLTTHEIDGNVDEARTYLLQDMAYSQALKAFVYADGVGAVPEDAPRFNLTDSPWHTDGRRAVMFLTDDNTPIHEVRFLDWPRTEPQ